jgi:hypothetical protein
MFKSKDQETTLRVKNVFKYFKFHFLFHSSQQCYTTHDPFLIDRMTFVIYLHNGRQKILDFGDFGVNFFMPQFTSLSPPSFIFFYLKFVVQSSRVLN